jgi:hypothetical protein
LIERAHHEHCVRGLGALRLVGRDAFLRCTPLREIAQRLFIAAFADRVGSAQQFEQFDAIQSAPPLMQTGGDMYEYAEACWCRWR